MRVYEIIDKLRELAEEHPHAPVYIESSSSDEQYWRGDKVVGVYFHKGKIWISADRDAPLEYSSREPDPEPNHWESEGNW